MDSDYFLLLVLVHEREVVAEMGVVEEKRLELCPEGFGFNVG